jgi:hypothetical protein
MGEAKIIPRTASLHKLAPVAGWASLSRSIPVCMQVKRWQRSDHRLRWVASAVAAVIMKVQPAVALPSILHAGVRYVERHRYLTRDPAGVVDYATTEIATGNKLGRFKDFALAIPEGF